MRGAGSVRGTESSINGSIEWIICSMGRTARACNTGVTGEVEEISGKVESASGGVESASGGITGTTGGAGTV